MRKLIERLLIFILGIPAVCALVFLFPLYRHLPLNIVVILFSAVGAVELSAMLKKKQIHISKAEAFILGSLAPLAVTLTLSFGIPEWIIPLLLMAGAGWALISRTFSVAEKLETVTNKITGCFSVIIYPGVFMYWIIKMNIWGNSAAIFLFLLITFCNDSMAWLFGTLFGKNNRGLISASPNKSIAGFVGGLAGSVIICVCAAIFIPSVFFSESGASGLLVKAIVLGLCTGFFATLGDLAESAIKRSCGFVDSGKVILGRGGVLDSIDSIAIAAPVFFMLFNIFFFTLF